jgi:hypothetical protein
LIPLQCSKVLRHILTPASTRPTTPTTTLNQQQSLLQAITSSLLDSTLLKQANATFNSQVMNGELLNTPARKYVKNLTRTSERLTAQVAILRKEKKDQELILGKRQERRSGKRAVIKGHFLLTTVEIRDKVKAAELETARMKASKGSTRKRKRSKTPSEDEEEEEDESKGDSDSDLSDCIVVGRR